MRTDRGWLAYRDDRWTTAFRSMHPYGHESDRGRSRVRPYGDRKRGPQRPRLQSACRVPRRAATPTSVTGRCGSHEINAATSAACARTMRNSSFGSAVKRRGGVGGSASTSAIAVMLARIGAPPLR